MNALALTHLALCCAATLASRLVAARPASTALALSLSVDLLYAVARGWPHDTLAAFVGPAAVVGAALRTYRVGALAIAALEAPLFGVAIVALVLGPAMGATGIAWLLVASQVYALAVGLLVSRRGLPTCALHSRLVGFLVASCGSGAIGWCLHAFGRSMRSAVVLDVFFFGAITIWSCASWSRHRSN